MSVGTFYNYGSIVGRNDDTPHPATLWHGYAQDCMVMCGLHFWHKAMKTEGMTLKGECVLLSEQYEADHNSVSGINSVTKERKAEFFNLRRKACKSVKLEFIWVIVMQAIWHFPSWKITFLAFIEFNLIQLRELRIVLIVKLSETNSQHMTTILQPSFKHKCMIETCCVPKIFVQEWHAQLIRKPVFLSWSLIDICLMQFKLQDFLCWWFATNLLYWTVTFATR